MDIDLGFLTDNGIDTKLGMEYTGNQEKYISAIQRYFKNFASNREKIEDFLEKEDYENYTIIVHALKSNSLMIGAKEVSEMFKMLEMAGHDLDIDTIKSKTGEVLSEYEKLIELLRPIGEADVKPPADEIGGEEAKKVSDELLEALDDFDDEKSLELISKLSGYPFRITQREKLTKATELVENFDYDSAAEIIKEIYGAIE